MKKVFVAACILLLLGMIGWKVSEPWREAKKEENQLLNTSDAKGIEHRITICGDEWLGYLIFRSPRFRSEMEKRAIAVNFKNEPDFQARFEMLDSGDCDLVCATIDSFLLNGESTNYPGVIVFGIDESYGGDAVIATEGIATLDDLRAENIKGAFVGFSPSEFLLKSQVAHFEIENLKTNLPSFRTDDAQTAYNRLKSGDADFAVLWEPFVSKSLREIPGATRLIDTRQARSVIYDVAIASRSLVSEKPAVVQAITDVYFDTLNYYSSDPEEFRKLAKKDSGESESNADTMLSGIRFLDLKGNRDMINGQGELRLTDAVANITRILVDVGDLSTDPLEGNPRLIVNSGFLQKSSSSMASNASTQAEPLQRFFAPLDETAWDALWEKRTGTLLEKPITFGVGQATIPEEFQQDLLEATQKLVHYPGHRIIVQAHVSPGSNKEADLALSQERANAIRDFLIQKGKISEHRVHAVGRGGEEPLAKESGEGLRSWKRRCRRARIYLAEDT